MQNDTTLTAAFDALLTSTIAMVGREKGVAAIRERLKAHAVPGLVAWFDEEYGVPKTRYEITTLSNGEVVSEPVSG